MFYVISEENCSPNQRDSDGAIDPKEVSAFISTIPGCKNMSGEICTDGWLGQTNDWSRHAHGEFETLEAAKEYCDEQGWTVDITTDEHGERTNEDPDVVYDCTTPSGAAAHSDAADWFQNVCAADMDIDADTTDERLSEIAKEQEEEALEFKEWSEHGLYLHGTLDYLTEMRNNLREGD